MYKPYNANTHHKRPSGLVVPIHAGIAGTLHWRVLDERGVPEVPRNPSGFALGPAEGVTQHNLFTNTGMDAVGTQSILNAQFRSYFHIGEGSTAPDVFDATLDSEVQRGNFSGQQGSGVTWDENYGPAGYIDALHKVSKALTMSANRNLTEFGFGPTNSADVYIRELFRDGGGNPTTISLLSGKILDVAHTIQVRLSCPAGGLQATFDIEHYDAANNLVSVTPVDYTYGPRIPSPGGPSYVGYAMNAWLPGYSGSDGAGAHAITAPLPPYSVLGGGITTSGHNSHAWEPYVPGSHERTWRGTLGTSHAIGPVYGLAKGSGAYGVVAFFDNPASFTKLNSETVSFSFTSTWSRL